MIGDLLVVCALVGLTAYAAAIAMSAEFRVRNVEFLIEVRRIAISMWRRARGADTASFEPTLPAMDFGFARRPVSVPPPVLSAAPVSGVSHPPPSEAITATVEPRRYSSTEVADLLATCEVSFPLVLEVCDCSGSSSGWGRCRRRGGVALILHAVEPHDRSEVAVKIYVPGETKQALDPALLVAVDTKLQELAARSPHFVRSRFARSGLQVTQPDGASHSFDIAIMPYLRSRNTRRLDEHFEAFLDQPRALLNCARALRETWRDCVLLNVAHGDLCAANIVVDASEGPEGPLRIVFLDLDTLSWPQHLDVVRTNIGQPGYFTQGRRADPAGYADRCDVTVWMIDVPAQIVIYLSVLAYAAAGRAFPAPDHTLAFDEFDLIRADRCDRRMEQIVRAIPPDCAGRDAVVASAEILRRHVAHPGGIDFRAGSPFSDGELMRRLAAAEQHLAGTCPAVREQEKHR